MFRIDALCTVKSSKRVYARDYVPNGIPFFRGREITQMSQNKPISKKLYISKDVFEEMDKKFGSPQIGDILLTAVGTIGNTWEVNTTPLYFKDGNIFWFSEFVTDIINPKYLKIVFESNWFQRLLRRKSSIGSVQNTLTIEKVKRLRIPLPSLDDQNRIVDQISKFSSLYNLNHTILRELEEYSKLLFHKWFIDFNFPNEKGLPYRKSGGNLHVHNGKLCPKDWTWSPLGRYISFQKGMYYASDDIDGSSKGIPMVNLDSFTNYGGYKAEGIKNYTGTYNETKYLHPFDLVVACTDVTRQGDIIGTPLLLPDVHGNHLLISCDVAHIQVKKPLDTYYVQCVLQQRIYRKYIKRFANGTNVLHLNPKGIARFHTYIPDQRTLSKFSEILENIEMKRSVLIKENQFLQNMRQILIQKWIATR